jgi:hypothetical protein
MKHNQIAQLVNKHIKTIELEGKFLKAIGGFTRLSLMKKPEPEDFCKIRELNR